MRARRRSVLLRDEARRGKGRVERGLRRKRLCHQVRDARAARRVRRKLRKAPRGQRVQQRAFVERARARSDFASPVEVLPGDRLVTLATCTYTFENARYLLLCRLTPLG